MRRLPVLLAIPAALAALLVPTAPADAAGPPAHVLVTAPRGLPAKARLAAAIGSGGRVGGIRQLGGGTALLTVAAPRGVRAAAAALRRVPGVAAAAPDSRIHLQTAAPVRLADPGFLGQWDLWDAAATGRPGGWGVDAPVAWTRTRGSSSVVVAVLDTGSTPHPDLLRARIRPGRDFVTDGQGIHSYDGNGWDANPQDPGDRCRITGDPSSWHGTFVAGEIAAQHDGRLLAGEAPGVSIEPVRILGGCGGLESDEIAAIEWASGGAVPFGSARLTNPSPAQVINLSVASEQPCSAPLQHAIDDARARGTVVVAAAGNDGDVVAGSAPADCRGVVSVAATTRRGNRAAYSNVGTSALAMTIAAPGGNDASPVLGDGWSGTGAFAAPGNRPGIAAGEGTSMAAPRVAAAVALLLSVQPGLTPDEVTARLLATATPFGPASTCTVVRCGAGIVSAGALVRPTG